MYRRRPKAVSIVARECDEHRQTHTNTNQTFVGLYIPPIHGKSMHKNMSMFRWFAHSKDPMIVSFSGFSNYYFREEMQPSFSGTVVCQSELYSYSDRSSTQAFPPEKKLFECVANLCLPQLGRCVWAHNEFCRV
jgi:hypothetical protein